LSVTDDKTMKDYVKSVVGSVLEYDEQNGSDYFEFIKMYLQNGASVQQAANHMYVHRNTIHYKIGKIKEIAGINLTDMEDLLKVAMCLKIMKMK
jgi:DNA-binding PucR family transcriptional regulator